MLLDTILEHITIEDILNEYENITSDTLKKVNNNYIGNCPIHGHDSKSKTSFSIDTINPQFNCFACENIKGNYIHLFEVLWHGVSSSGKGFTETFKQTVIKLCKKYNIEFKLSEEDSNKLRIYHLLLEACNLYNSQLKEEDYNFLYNQYGLTKKFIDDEKIGIAKDNIYSLLLKSYSKEEILSTGLFWKNSKHIYENRYVFPYKINNQIKYTIGRATDKTIPFTNQNKPSKYLKQLLHSIKRPFISKYISNILLYSYYDKEEIIITEGITDYYILKQNKINCVSPVTIRFRNEDYEKVSSFCSQFKHVYICNDSEVSKSGEKGAIGTAKYLLAKGILTNIIILPNDRDKTDLNEFIKEKGIEEFKNLQKKSLSYLDFMLKEFNPAMDKFILNKELEFLFDKLSYLSEAEIIFFIQEKVKMYFGLNKREYSKVLTSFINTTLAKKKAHSKDLTQELKKEKKDDILKIIENINSKYIFVKVKGKRFLLEENFNNKTEPLYTLNNISDVKIDYMNKLYYPPSNGSKASSPVNPIDLWLSHPLRPDPKTIDFIPDKNYVNPKIYNCFRGFGIKPIKKSKKYSCDLFLRHVREVLSNDNEDLYNYILDWLADAVQNLTDRPFVALVLKGLQGAGKNAFVSYLSDIFAWHYQYLGHSDGLTGHFNSSLEAKLLVFADEATWGGDKKGVSKLKSYISEPTIQINGKFVPDYTARNYMRMIVASNNDWVIPAEERERRFCVLNMNPKYSGNRKYFNNLYLEIANNGPAVLLDFLLNRDISKVEIKDFPRTDALLNQIQHNYSSTQAFFHELLSEGGIESFLPLQNSFSINHKIINDNMLSINKTDFFNLYKFWCNSHKNYKKIEVLKSQFGAEIVKYFKDAGYRSSTLGKENAHVFPSLDKCRKSFEGCIGQKVFNINELKEWKAIEILY